MQNIILNNIIQETINKYLGQNLIKENAQDRRINNLIKQYYPESDFEKIRSIRANILNLIPNARARKGKWLYKVIEWFLNNKIPHEEYKRFNNYLGYLHNNIDTEQIYNNTWDNLTFNDIKQHYDELFPSSGKTINKIESYEFYLLP